jgi:hypothetical protein
MARFPKLTVGDEGLARADYREAVKEDTLTSRNEAQGRSGAKARQGEALASLATFSDLAPLAGMLSAHSRLSRGFDGMRRRASSGLDEAHGDHPFSEEDQIRQEPTKKMLKMQVAPNMLLKTKGSKTENFGLANMFMKTSSLYVFPICR